MEYDQSAVTDWSLWVSVIAVFVAVASILWARYTHIVAPKRDVLRRLLGSRHLLTDAMKHRREPGEPYIALNEIAVAFYKDDEVVQALKRYSAAKSNANLIVLIREMAKAAYSSLDKFDDNFLMTPFTLNGHQARPD